MQINETSPPGASADKTNMRRNLGLDLLRLLAIVLVLGNHMELPLERNAFLRSWKIGGWVGVDLFFVLSGFLVSGLLYKEHLKKGTLDIKRFLIRRGLKIYPPFYVFLIVTLIIYVSNDVPFTLLQVLGEFFFFQNYLGSLWGHTWSLAVEEHFYIGISILFVLLLKRRSSSKDPFRNIPLYAAGIAVVCLTLRIVTYQIWDGYSHRRLLFGTHIRIDSLMVGCLLSYLWHYRGLADRTARLSPILLFAVGCMAFIPAFIYQREAYPLIAVYGLVLFYLGAGLMVLASTRLKATTIPVGTLLGVLGAASYSIYLWHLPIEHLCRTYLLSPTDYYNYPLYLSVYIVLSLCAGYVMSKLVEWPILRLRDKFFPSKSTHLNSSIETSLDR